MNKLRLAIALSSIFSLVSCGSSDDSSTPTTEEPQLSTINVEVVVEHAIEQTNQVAKIRVSRTNPDAALSVSYTLGHSDDITVGKASDTDYQLRYEDGSDIGQSIQFSAEQSYRIIEVVPISDDINEVPEWLQLSLNDQSSYVLGDANALISIIDAENNETNSKVFYGTFYPQQGAVTSASGVLSFILAGDNSHGHLNYSFNNLSSEQTDQHIHLAPSGIALKDIEDFGNITQLHWDLSPSGIFTTQQEMLDALFNGEFFVNIHTANYPHGEISATLLYDENIQAPDDFTLSENDIDRDIIRFLNQATFGATPTDYQSLRTLIEPDGSNRIQVYNSWIDQQIALQQTSMFDLTEAVLPLFGEENPENIRRDVFWTMATQAKDQLRQKTAFALSQILVVSDELSTIRKSQKGLSNYWDMLAEQSFGQYNQLLKDVSLSPIMGVWLSHLKNQKEDADKGYFPDENYAREIMQLFSFGLVHRQANGSIKLGDNNLPAATYDNEVIKEMARVFTGLSFGAKETQGIKTSNSSFNLGDWVNDYQYRWTEPMRFFPEHHDFGEKTLFTDNGQTVVIPASEEHTSEAALNELTQVVNALVSHSSTAPFVARRLIQRFVTSNPSPDYLQRVATAFASTGDLTATIKAILLDQEARNPHLYQSATAGKYKEPAVQFIHTLKMFNAQSSVPLGDGTNGLGLAMVDQFTEQASLLRVSDLALGQRALGAPSVFNFFLPDYAPSGEISKQSLVAPEMQVLNEAQLFTTLNIYQRLAYWGVNRNSAHKNSDFSKEQLMVKPKFTLLNQIWQATDGDNDAKIKAVLEYADFYLNAGLLSQSELADLKQQLLDSLSGLEQDEVFRQMLYAFNALPQFLVQF